MRSTPVIVLVFVIFACSNGEKATNTTDSTITDNATPVAAPTTPIVTQEQPIVTEASSAPETTSQLPDDFGDTTFYLAGLKNKDTLYNILARKHLGANVRPSSVGVEVLSKNVMDFKNPSNATNLLAAWITTKKDPTITYEGKTQIGTDYNGNRVQNDKWGQPISEYVVTLAIFDPSNSMKLFAYCYIDQSLWSEAVEEVYQETVTTLSDPGISAEVIQIIDKGGDVISIGSSKARNRSSVDNTTTDREDWYGLIGNKIQLINSFESGNTFETLGSGENDRSEMEASWKTKKAKAGAIPDVVITSTTRRKQVDQEDAVEEQEQILTFNGAEYVEKEN